MPETIALSFAPGEAQFDWSHEVVLINGTTVTVKVADVRLCHSRMLFVRAYPRETQEILLNTFLDIQDELREQVLLRPGLSIGGAWEHADVSRWLATGASLNCARQRIWLWTQTAIRQLSGGGA